MLATGENGILRRTSVLRDYASMVYEDQMVHTHERSPTVGLIETDQAGIGVSSGEYIHLHETE